MPELVLYGVIALVWPGPHWWRALPDSPDETTRSVELTEVESAVTQTEGGDLEVVVGGARPGVTQH